MTAFLPAQVTQGQKPKLPAPFETKAAGNGPNKEKPPAGFLPKVSAGFQVSVYASGFKRPRWLTVAPNGDIFLADTTGSGQIIVLRSGKDTSAAPEREVFVDGMNRPFGIVFHDDYVYVGNMNELVRFKYDPKTSKRLGEKEHLMSLHTRSEEHTSELQSQSNLVCRLLLEKKKNHSCAEWTSASKPPPRRPTQLNLSSKLTFTPVPVMRNTYLPRGYTIDTVITRRAATRID